jgi:hypothetical protein
LNFIIKILQYIKRGFTVKSWLTLKTETEINQTAYVTWSRVDSTAPWRRRLLCSALCLLQGCACLNGLCRSLATMAGILSAVKPGKRAV